MISFIVRFGEECVIEPLVRDGVSKSSIDMDLYSRQIPTYDMKTMKLLIKLKVLIIGLKGVGVETAKNVILAGPQSVILHDNNPTETRDLNTNFYLTEACVRSCQSRAAGCVHELSRLNPNVEVSTYTGEIDERFLAESGVSVVVMTLQASKKRLIELDEICRRLNITFISSTVNGLSCTIFTDFGEQFKVWDDSGISESEVAIQMIEVGKNQSGERVGVVYTENVHMLSDGDIVKFSELEGSTELNGCTFGVTTDLQKPHSFEIVETEFSPYVDRGVCVRQKQPVFMEFRSLANSLLNPVAEGQRKLLNPDDGKHQRSAQLHLALLAVWEFNEIHGFFPEIKNVEHSQECIEIAGKLLEDHKNVVRKPITRKLDESVVENVAHYFQTEIVGLTAAIGGLTAQEVIKTTGKCTPIQQWMHFDTFELLKPKIDKPSKLSSQTHHPASWGDPPTSPNGLPSSRLHPASIEVKDSDDNSKSAGSVTGSGGVDDNQPSQSDPDWVVVQTPSRYENQITIFGKEFQSRLENMKIFMIGAGALGCEYLKNLALMGVGCGPQGKLYVTDMDSITVSNLNRQFLFRSENVGASKSDCAVEAVAVMNPQTAEQSNIHLIEEELEGKHERLEPKYLSQNIEVSPQTENMFDYQFWESLDLVITAVDNRQARQYVDSKCLLHQTPLLESGTLGMTGQTQIFLPHLTESYADIPYIDEEVAIPVCTLKHFPYQIQHCIEWAREQFGNFFTFEPQAINSFVNTKNKFLENLDSEKSLLVQQKKLETVKRWLLYMDTVSLRTFVEMALEIFHREFRNEIIDLTTSFPEDFTIGDPPMRYWMGRRRFPTPVRFDITNELHLSFIVSAGNIFACVFGFAEKLAAADVLLMLQNYVSPRYVPSKALKVTSETEVEEVVTDTFMDTIQTLKEDLLKMEVKLASNASSKTADVLTPVEFEKDDEKNHHIDFITAFSNLRASNYGIKLADRHQCKIVAGKIQPAVATSTSVVTGLNSIELMKVAFGVDDLGVSDFRSNHVMLACPPFITMLQPSPPERVITVDYDPFLLDKVVAIPEGFSSWDTIYLEGNFTVGEFIKELAEKHHNVIVDGLRKHGRNVKSYMNIGDTSKELRDLYVETYGEIADAQPLIIGGSFLDQNLDLAKIPRVCYTSKNI